MSPYSTYDDGQLMTHMGQGEEGALTELYHRHWKFLYNAAYQRLKNTEQAQDIVQDVFTALWRRRGTSNVDNLPAYLSTAVQYQVWKIVSKRNAGVSFFELFDIETDDGAFGADEIVRRKELLALVSRWIETLPEKRRVIFQLHYTEGLNSQEIAERLNISPKTVRNQLGTSHESLRLELSRFLTLLLMCP